MTFGEQVKVARMVKGYTTEILAELLDCDASNLIKIELGKHEPKPLLKSVLENFTRNQLYSQFR